MSDDSNECMVHACIDLPRESCGRLRGQCIVFGGWIGRIWISLDFSAFSDWLADGLGTRVRECESARVCIVRE